ncbi:MAG TPA: hypothetical protein VFZ23_10330 [Pyrinomonadaceae bacterium]
MSNRMPEIFRHAGHFGFDSMHSVFSVVTRARTMENTGCTDDTDAALEAR